MVIYIEEYLRRRQQRELAMGASRAQALRMHSRRAVAALSARVGTYAEPPLGATDITHDAFIAQLYAEASMWDDATSSCELPHDIAGLSQDASYMAHLYQQASLV